MEVRLWVAAAAALVASLAQTATPPTLLTGLVETEVAAVVAAGVLVQTALTALLPALAVMGASASSGALAAATRQPTRRTFEGIYFDLACP